MSQQTPVDYKKACDDLFGSEAEPSAIAYDTRTIVLSDGRGGKCRFLSSEASDVVNIFAPFVKNDAPPTPIIDLRTVGDTK